jgi:lipoyl(octanoyl) transferase
VIERRLLGLVDYAETFAAMKTFTQHRNGDTPDQLWLLEHPPVFTQGVAGKASHLLAPGDIPVVKIDRGGQVTYHGPGQWVVYVLLDIRRSGLTVRGLVTAIERAVIAQLAQYGIKGESNPKAPGVYVDERKIAALGLKVSRGCSYHGVSLNVDMDLEPFRRINPCGHAGLEVISMATLLGATALDKDAIGQALLDSLEHEFTHPTT